MERTGAFKRASRRGDHRPEDFLGGDPGGCGHLVQQGRGEERSGLGVSAHFEVADAEEFPRPPGDGVVHHPLDVGACLVVNERTAIAVLVQSLAEVEARERVAHARGEGIVDGFMDKDAVGGDADLARDQGFEGDQLAAGQVEVGVLADDEWRVALEFEGDAFDGRGAVA